MKRLRSFDNDLDVVGGDKGSLKDWERRDRDRDRERSRDRDRDRSLERSSSSHRSSRYYSSKAENGRNRTIDDDRESSRLSRKRLDHHEYDGFDRRRTSPRYRDSIDRDRGVSISSPRNVYGNNDRIHRSESFSGFRRDFPKGYVSERERERSSREESVSSWRRLSGCKDIVEEDYKIGAELGRGSRVLLEDRGNVKSPQGSREVVRSPQGSREVVRSPQGSREVLKSPQGSREVIKSPQSSREVIKSSQSPREVVKSPPGSKDSWGEQSKSVDGKRSDEVHGVSSSSSEMEEGELGPETEPELESIPEPLVQTNIEAEISLRGNSESKNVVPEEKFNMEKTLIDDSKPLPKKKLEHDMEGVCDENEEGKTLDTMTAASKGSDGLQECCSASEEKEGNIREDNDFLHSSDHVTAEKDGNEEVNNANSDKSSCPYEEPKEKDSLYLELQVEEIDSKELSTEENRNSGKTLALMTDTLMGKDKGKRVAIYPSSEINSRENSQWLERDLLGCRDDALDGPSSRGFELFSSSVVSRPEKTNHSVVSNDGKLKDEPLELSLGLPNVLLPLPSHDSKAAPSSPSRARSVHSLPNTFRTSSEGFSGSMSFSGSQTFVHNPSCSLTQNSYENYEQSVGSHPIFQGIDQQASQVTWPGQFPNDPKHVEPPIYQRLLYGNGSLGSHTPQGIIYSQAMQAQEHKFQLTEGNTGIPVGLDRQSNLHRQLSGLQSKNNIEVRSPTNSVGSRGTRSEFSNDKKHLMKGKNGSLYRSSSQRAMDQVVVGGIGFVERIITMIISEPVQVMARRIQEMEEQSITFLKESACEIMANKDKHGQLVAVQEALKKRSDLTVEELLKCHRVQLEILVAFKTGLQDFFQRVSSIASSDLAEIYLNLRCKNLACLSLLPVDDCDCKVCVQKNGFCSACMCLICSKFDMALNTCSWVGCDVCLHWCHTDCGLQKSYVRNGRISGEAQDTTEMQFHCVACNHPSEMFGFVKEVFKTCAKEWSIETLTKELEYVKRIFSASNDRRGKQLYIIADKMIARLEIKSNLTEVYNRIMQFLAESDADFGNTPSVSLKERPHKNSAEDSNRVVGPSQVAMMLASASTENIPQRETNNTAPSRLDWDQVGGRSGNLELQVSVGKMPVVDELESIIRIKLAEAKMFQSRADDARKEAEGLKCIAVAKNDKIDEEYSSRITKLRLAEAEERHKQKLEELKIMEKEHREYFNMKMRMESDIRVLLLKMEATKQNYST